MRILGTALCQLCRTSSRSKSGRALSPRGTAPLMLASVVALALFAGGAGAVSTQLPQQSGLISLPADANLEISGANAYDNAGDSVAGAGDMNGDGLADIIVGAPGASNNGRRRSGSVYIVFGQGQPGISVLERWAPTAIGSTARQPTTTSDRRSLRPAT